MAKSDSSAGDLAEAIREAIREDLQRRGNEVDWIEGECDVLGVTDSDGAQMFVKIELV
jgi:Arc/MetJ-type ribon-helix-helix transcriptional regulator